MGKAKDIGSASEGSSSSSSSVAPSSSDDGSRSPSKRPTLKRLGGADPPVVPAHGFPGSAGDADPPAPSQPGSSGDAVKAPRVLAPPVAPRVAMAERSLVIDGEEFTELWPKGLFSGYSIKCITHKAEGCDKNCGFGTGVNAMTPDECRRRLLLWRDAGFDEDDMADHRRRGGKPLFEFS